MYEIYRRHYLLAASGISPGSALRDLNDLNATTGVGAIPQQAEFDTDNAAYVSNLQSQSTLALIAEGINRSARDFDRFLEENVTMEWDAQRLRIYQHFGLVSKEGEGASGDDLYGSPAHVWRGGFGKSSRRGRGLKSSTTQAGSPSGGSLFGASGLQKSVIGSPGRAGAGQTTLFADVGEKNGGISQAGVDDRFLREKEAKFADRVQLLNELRLQDRVYPVLQEFGNVEAQAGGDQVCQSSCLMDFLLTAPTDESAC